MISKTPSMTLEDFLATLTLTDNARKRCRRSVASYGDILGRSPSIDDLSNEPLVALPDQLSAVNVSANVVTQTICYLRLIWREAYARGLTLELPPAWGTSHRPNERSTRRPKRSHDPSLRTPISEPPPACLTLDSPLLDVALHMAHARQADCHPKTREHYRSSVRRFETYLERESTGHDLTDATLEALRDSMHELGYSFSTCQGTRWNLRALWNHLHHEGIRDDIPENPRPVNVPPAAPVDISSVLAIHKAVREREQAERPSKRETVRASIWGMLKRLVNPPSKPPTITAPPASDRDPATLTIAELIAAWRVFASEYHKPAELMNMDCALRPLEAFYGRELVKDFGPKKLRAVVQLMVDGYTLGDKPYRGLSRKHINARTSRIKRVFKWGVAEELVSAAIYQALASLGPLRHGRTKAPEREPILPVDEAIVDATLPHLPPVIAAMVQFERYTGCRPGEVVALRPCDLDRSGEIWLYKPPLHKTAYCGRVRTIYVGPRAQAVLLPYLEGRDPEHHCFSPRESELWRAAKLRLERKTPVQPSQVDRSKPNLKRKLGRAYSRESFSKAIRRTCKLHGIEPWHPNQLRHLLATSVRREFGLEAAQVILGHSRADVTQVYAERHDANGVDVMRRIG